MYYVCKCKIFRMEKFALRSAFDVPEDPYLPQEVLWRQKEQFRYIRRSFIPSPGGSLEKEGVIQVH